jgi:hypothetical protein
MLTRKHPAHTITNYISVPSVEKTAAKVQKLGGSICMPRTAVPRMGYFVICQDTENNTFALWEMNANAKEVSRTNRRCFAERWLDGSRGGFFREIIVVNKTLRSL